MKTAILLLAIALPSCSTIKVLTSTKDEVVAARYARYQKLEDDKIANSAEYRAFIARCKWYAKRNVGRGFSSSYGTEYNRGRGW